MFTGRLYGGTPTTDTPSCRTSPLVGCSKPAIKRSEVVLPQPDGPSSAWKRPRGIAKLASSNATMSPKSFVTWTNSMSTGSF